VGNLVSGQDDPALASASQQTKLPLSTRLKLRLGAFALNVAFELPAGITILFGASGAGKTTLLNCLAGLLKPQSGSLTVDGQVLYDSGAGIDVPVQQRQVAYLFQQLALFPHLSVLQNVEYGLAELERQARRLKAQAILERFGIAGLSGRRPGEISGGERQRAALARALVREPKYLLLDEPLAALDAATKGAIIDDLRRWNRERQVPVLYVTHDRSEVFGLGEHLLVLDQGRIAAAGTPYEVLQEPRREFIASLAGFENLLRARVQSEHPEAGTMTVSLAAAGVTLECPLHRGELGMAVRVGIRAGDIMVSLAKPVGLSARNILPATIRSLRRMDVLIEAYTEAIATAPAEGASPVPFRVHLTGGAVDALQLREGQQIYLVIKTHSCRVMHDG
jgi:molybdate transport system ATP-binding protein